MNLCCRCTGVDEGWNGGWRSHVGTGATALILLSSSSSSSSASVKSKKQLMKCMHRRTLVVCSFPFHLTLSEATELKEKCTEHYMNFNLSTTFSQNIFISNKYAANYVWFTRTRVGILILVTSRQIGYKNCWSDAPMQQEGWVLPLPTYIMGAVHHKMGIRSSQLIVSRCRDSV